MLSGSANHKPCLAAKHIRHRLGSAVWPIKLILSLTGSYTFSLFLFIRHHSAAFFPLIPKKITPIQNKILNFIFYFPFFFFYIFTPLFLFRCAGAQRKATASRGRRHIRPPSADPSPSRKSRKVIKTIEK